MDNNQLTEKQRKNKLQRIVSMLAKAHEQNTIVNRNDAGTVAAHIVAQSKGFYVRGGTLLDGVRYAEWINAKEETVKSGNSSLYINYPSLDQIEFKALEPFWHKGKREVEKTGFTAAQLKNLNTQFEKAGDDFVGLVACVDLLVSYLGLTLTVDEKVQVLYAEKGAPSHE